MTTIAVSRSLMMMAADSNMTIDGRKHVSDPKLFRTKDYIAGAAGDGDAIVRFLNWLKTKEGKRPRGQYQVLVLFRDGQIVWMTEGDTVIEEDHFAIGTGASAAVSAMDTMAHMGLPIDPRIAVQVACKRDTMSAEPIHSLRWAKHASRSKGK